MVPVAHSFRVIEPRRSGWVRSNVAARSDLSTAPKIHFVATAFSSALTGTVFPCCPTSDVGAGAAEVPLSCRGCHVSVRTAATTPRARTVSDAMRNRFWARGEDARREIWAPFTTQGYLSIRLACVKKRRAVEILDSSPPYGGEIARTRDALGLPPRPMFSPCGESVFQYWLVSRASPLSRVSRAAPRKRTGRRVVRARTDRRDMRTPGIRQRRLPTASARRSLQQLQRV